MKTLLTGLICLGTLLTASVQGQGATEETATFAGGCFWCMEPAFDHVKGVAKVVVGYTGGHTADPTYEDVSSGETGHTEAIRITFDPAVVDYAALLDIFLKNIDPTAKNRQFCDVGTQYRSAIFYHNGRQRELAEKKKAEVEKNLGIAVQTEIRPAVAFYPAEDYHQQFYKKNPLRYNSYKYACGREKQLKEIWKDR